MDAPTLGIHHHPTCTWIGEYRIYRSGSRYSTIQYMWDVTVDEVRYAYLSTVMHHTYDTMAAIVDVLLKVSGVMHVTWVRIDPVATVDLSTPSHATDAPSCPMS